MRYIKIAQAAQRLQVSTKTLRRWEEDGILVPKRTPGGQRVYVQSQIENFVRPPKMSGRKKVTVTVTVTDIKTPEPRKRKTYATSFAAMAAVILISLSIFGGLTLNRQTGLENTKVLAAETTFNPVWDFLSNLFAPIASFFTNTYNDAQVAFTSFVSQPITTTQIASQTPAPSITNITNNNVYNSAPVAISPRSLTGAMIGLKTVQGENLADNTITADKLAPTLTFTANDLLDLSAVNHSSSTNQGLILPNVPNSSPSTPTSGKGYIAFDTADNKLIVYTSSGWQTVGSGSSSSTSTTVNNLSGSITLAGAGINAVTTSGSTITVTGTEADTLATVTGRGATTTTALSLGDVSLGASNALVVGSYTTDPTSPSNGTIWYNTTSGKWKIREGGTTKILCNTTDAGCGAGGGSTAWSSILDPVGNLALSMGANTTTFTYNGTTGTGNLFKLIDTASNTGTGYIFDAGTAASSNAKPFTIVARGTAIIDTTAAGALTLGSATTTLALTSSTWGINSSGTATSLAISGATNTLSSIGNSSLTNSSVTINSSGILTGGGALSLGGSLTLTATEADTLSSVTGRGASTATALTLSSASPINFSGTTPTITFSGGDTTLDLTGAATRTLNILNSTTAQVSNLNLSDGSLQTGGTTRLDNTGNLSNIGNLAGSGTVSGFTISGASNTLSNIGNTSLTNSSITINSSGILTGGASVALGGSVTLTATEADTLSSVTGRGATTATGLTLSAASPLTLSNAAPVVTLATLGTNGVLTIKDAEAVPNTLLTLTDSGTSGTLTVNTLAATNIGAFTATGNITGSGSPTISSFGTINGATLSGGSLSGGTISGGTLSGTALSGTGSFTITGGTGASETLTLISTANATKGNIQFFSSANSIDSSGNLTAAGNIAANGGSLTTTQTTANLFNANATTLNIGGAATTLNLTGAGSAAFNFGNATGTTALNLTSGTGAQTFSSSVATGLLTSGAFVFKDAALSTGDMIYATASAITSGNILKLGQGGNTNFTGNVIYGDMDNTGQGGIGFTGNFLKFDNAGVNKYFVDSAGNASESGTLTIGNGSVIRPAYGPLTLQYKSGANTWANALSINDTTGYVGIGTTSPSGSVLRVQGSTDVNTLSINNTAISSNQLLSLTGPASAKAFSVFTSGEGFARSEFYTDGKFGIGPGNATRDVYLSRSAANTFTVSSDGATGTAGLVVTGDIAANTGNLTTTAATATLFNTNATTLSVGGAATTLNLGPTGSGASSVVLSGGSADTGCTLDGATGNFTCSGSIISSAATGTQGFWSIGSGALYPNNNTIDLLVGASATTSAKFAFTGVNGGLPTASIAGNIANVASYLTGNGNLATTNMRDLTLGGSTTGQVIINSRGTATITANGSATTVAGDLNSGAATAALFNTTTTNLSIGGAATTLNLQGAGSATFNIGNATGTTALNLTSGTGSQTFTSSANGELTAAGEVFKNATVSTGDLIYATASAITTGDIVHLGQGGDSAFSGNGLFMDFDNTGGGGGTFTGNFLKFNNAGATKFVVAASGAITAPTTSNTINSLVINSGALSSVTGIAMSSGNFSQTGTGTFSTGTGAVTLNGTTSLGSSGAGLALNLYSSGAVNKYATWNPASSRFEGYDTGNLKYLLQSVTGAADGIFTSMNAAGTAKVAQFGDAALNIGSGGLLRLFKTATWAVGTDPSTLGADLVLVANSATGAIGINPAGNAAAPTTNQLSITNSTATDGNGIIALDLTNSATTGVVTENIQKLQPNGTSTVGTNSINDILFKAPLTPNSNNFYALNFETGYTDLLRYNGAQLISGTGILQSAGLSGTYSNALTLSSTSNALTGTIGLSTPLAGAFTTVSATGDIAANSGNLTTTQTTATLFNTNATTLSVGGAATTFNLQGAGSATLNIGNATGTTAINVTSGTGSQTFTSSANGELTAAGEVFKNAAVTTGDLIYATASAITTGDIIHLGQGGNTNFTGNGIFMDFDQTGQGGIGFTGKFLNLANAGTTEATIDSSGNIANNGYYTAVSGANLKLRASGNGIGQTGTGSIYFQDSTGTTRGRVDTTKTALNTGTGATGALTVTTTTTINDNSGVNYGLQALSASAASNQATIPIASTTNFAAGDEVLVIQMQGNGAGSYEFRTVSSVNANTSVVVSENLTHNYTEDATSSAQLVEIPQFTNVTITAGKLTAPAWNGSTGGILAFRATGTVSCAIASCINMTGLGFRGGASTEAGTAFQGEGISTASLTTNSTGTAYNAGGGGGRGVGGGGGAGGAGYTTSSSGTAGAGGTNGSSGKATEPINMSRLYMGAGAGGGGDDSGTAGIDGGTGGNGGGIIYFAADQLQIGTSASISNDGNAGGAGTGTNSGGAGGGGGGPAFVQANRISILNPSTTKVIGGSGGTAGAKTGTGGAGGTGGVGATRLDAYEITGINIDSSASIATLINNLNKNYGTFNIGAIDTQAADVAEMYQSENDLEPGDIVTTSGNITDPKINPQYAISYATQKGSPIMGAISTKPGMVLGSLDIPDSYREFPVALNGRTPVNVINTNGAIHKGDQISISSVRGIGEKAAGSGYVVGYALEDFVPGVSASSICPTTVKDDQGNTAVCGSVMTFIQPGWFDATSQVVKAVNDNNNQITFGLNANGEVTDSTISAVATSSGEFVLPDWLGKLADPVRAMQKAIVANIESGSIKAKSVTTDTLNVTNNNYVNQDLFKSSEASISAQIDALRARVDTLETQLPFPATAAASVSTSSASLMQTLNVLGSSLLSDTVVNGKLSIGIITVDNQNGSIDAIGKLKLQPLALGSIEFQNNSIEIDTKGNLNIKKGVIIGNSSIRDAVEVPFGQTTIKVEKTWDSAPATVILTPSYQTTVWATDVTDKGFTINIGNTTSTTQKIYWQAMW